MPVITIEDQDDERLADYRNVPDPELVERRGIFVAEGRFVVRPNLPVYRVSQTVMNGVTGFNIHRGCLAIGERPAPMSWSALVARARTILVLERIGNPDNVGGIFRNAIAFGADAILIGPACADPLYRKAIRTSMGAALLVPFARAEPWPDALRQLRDLGFASVALTPSAGAAAIALYELKRAG